MILLLALAVACAAAVRGLWSPCGLSMLTTLNPVSESARGMRFGVTAAWYVAGALAGGTLLGLGCAGLAQAVAWTGPGTPVRLLVGGMGAGVCVLSDSTLVRRHLPDHPRQVNERWVGTYRRWIYAGGFGVQIGAGFATYIMTAGVYLTALLAALTGSPVAAVLVGVVFGGVRGLTILTVVRVQDAASLRSLVGAVERRSGLSLRLVGVVQAAVAGVAVGVLVPVAGVAVAVVLVGVAVAGSPSRVATIRFSRPLLGSRR